MEEAERRLAAMAKPVETALAATDKGKGKGKGKKGDQKCRHCDKKGHI